MKKSLPLLSVIALLIVCFSLVTCADEEETPLGNLFSLSVGDYWIYRTKIISPEGEFESDQLDSMWVSGETSIEGKKYWILETFLNGTYHARDSGDCILLMQSNYEQIIFSLNTRDTLLRHPPFYKIMTEVSKTITVPAGSFEGSTCVTLLDKEVVGSGQGFPDFNDRFVSSDEFTCARNVGLIRRAYYYVGARIEHNLVRYRKKL